jgi:hypothetical protein
MIASTVVQSSRGRGIMQLDRQRIMNDALAGAVAFEAQQQSRGIPPLETAAARIDPEQLERLTRFS